MATMRAILVRESGGPDVLKLADVERPVPMPTEVLIRVRAVGLNPVEAFIAPANFQPGKVHRRSRPSFPAWTSPRRSSSSSDATMAAARSIEVLRPGGLLITAVERLDETLKRAVEAAGRRFMGITVEPDGPGLEALARLVEEGKLDVHVEQSFPLSEAPRAHAALTGSTTGKLVLLV